MEFNPANHVVRLCIQGMALEEQGLSGEAMKLFDQAWNVASNDFEKFLAAHFVARGQETIPERLKWLEISLQAALKVNSPSAMSAFPKLHSDIARCYEELGDQAKAKQHLVLARSYDGSPSDPGPFYHGTKADLQEGDLLTPGNRSNYSADLIMNHIYFTALIHGAGLAAALAKGEGRERVYIVEPTGSFENDPNVTDKKFPGNPTRSYRTEKPLKIVGELADWSKQTPGDIRKWREKLANSQGKIIN